MRREYYGLRVGLAGSAEVAAGGSRRGKWSTWNSMAVCEPSSPWRGAMDAGRRRLHD
jgi:hypothetical protein